MVCKMTTKIEIREFSEEEFLDLSSDKTEKTVYSEIWEKLEKKLSGKNVNNAYLKDVFLKIAKSLEIETTEYIDSILYAHMTRLVKNKKAEKKYLKEIGHKDIVVWRFI